MNNTELVEAHTNGTTTTTTNTETSKKVRFIVPSNTSKNTTIVKNNPSSLISQMIDNIAQCVITNGNWADMDEFEQTFQVNLMDYYHT